MTNISLKDLIVWYIQEDKMISFKDKLMVRGGGMLWVFLFVTSWVFLATIILRDSVYKQFDALSLVLPGVGLLIIGIIFSFIEINRIKILRRYDRYVKEWGNKLKQQYDDKIAKVQTDLAEFNNLLITLRSQRGKESHDKDDIWSWDWDELINKIHIAYKNLMGSKVS